MVGIESIIYLLVYLLIACLILYLAFWALNKSNVQEPFKSILVVIFALIAIVIILRSMGML